MARQYVCEWCGGYSERVVEVGMGVEICLGCHSKGEISLGEGPLPCCAECGEEIAAPWECRCHSDALDYGDPDEPIALAGMEDVYAELRRVEREFGPCYDGAFARDEEDGLADWPGVD